MTVDQCSHLGGIEVARRGQRPYMPAMTSVAEFLISDVARLLRRRFGERARMLGATRPQWRTLTILSRHEGIAEPGLADLVEVEPANLARMLDRLVTSGLVERRPGLGTLQHAQVFLTDASRPVLRELVQIADDMVEEAFAGVAPADRVVLERALAKMRGNLVGPMAPRGRTGR